MQNIQLGIEHLSLNILQQKADLQEIYDNVNKNYYWSDDFSPHFYIAQAKAGFIAVTDIFQEEELLLPEIQFAYALLDFKNLHISKKVKKLIEKQNLKIEISNDLDSIAHHVESYHKNSWLTKRYLQTLKACQKSEHGFKVISVYLKDGEKLISGEIGYVIGRTYTSLSGFSSKEKVYANWGTAQLVLLGVHLQENGFAFWNLGQPYMPYKLSLGAKIYDRKTFLKRWHDATGNNHA